jgi:hypothetical protein
MNIKNSVTKEQVGLILGSRDTQLAFLLLMKEIWEVPTKLNRKGVEVIDTKLISDITQFIIDNWNYEEVKQVLREMFRHTEKYRRGMGAKEMFNRFKQKYLEMGYVDYKWPFVSGQFDAYAVKMVVYPSVADEGKFDEGLKRTQKDVEKFSYLKIFNTLRNDYLEYLIFNADQDIIPTFSHRGGIDFYIHGIGFDQKVSRSVTNQFMDTYGDNWREVALEQPYEVTRYLMELGDEARFSNVPRLFIIDVDGSYELDGIEEKVGEISFDEPHTVTYTYNHSSTGPKNYSCPVICLMLTQ